MVAALVLACLVLTAGVSRELGGWGAALLAGLSVVWLRVNGSMEGLTIVDLSATHGITGADLAGAAGLGLAAVQGGRAYRQRRRDEA
jgi:hypothetical protein